MPELLLNIPAIECFVQESYLTGNDKDAVVQACVIHSVTCIPGRALLFNILLRDGSMYSRLPIWAFQSERYESSSPSEEKPQRYQTWEVPSAHACCTVLDLVKEGRVTYLEAPDTWSTGTYLFTLDFYGTPEAEGAGDLGHKWMHVIALDIGTYVASPNTRVAFTCPAYTDKKLWCERDEPVRWRSQQRTWHAERF